MGVEYRTGQLSTLAVERSGESAGDSDWQVGPWLHLGGWLDLDLLVDGHLRDEHG